MIIGTYSGASASATEFSTFEELLSKLPDNNTNSIHARDVRDSVYTLWQRVDDVAGFASQSASASVLYTNANPTPIDFGGIAMGTTFSQETVSDMFDMLLYPYIPPVVSLTQPSTLEKGASPVVMINYNITKGSENLQTVIGLSNGFNISLPTNILSGFFTHSSTQNETTTYSIQVNDGVNTVSATTSTNWAIASYYGTHTSFSSPGMDLPDPKTAPAPLWANGASAGNGRLFPASYTQSYNGINGNGNYLVFAWPENSSYTPKFIVNGNINTSFTLVGQESYENGTVGHYTSRYDMYVSDIAYNSAIYEFRIM